jgi:chromosome segregation ATPase
MAIRSNKRVSFQDEKIDLTTEQVFELQRENNLLKGKLFEMEEFCEKAESCFSQYTQSIEKIQSLSETISDLKSSDLQNKSKIKELEVQNSHFLTQNQKLRSEISDLKLKKQLLESEIERLNNNLHQQELKNSSQIKPNSSNTPGNPCMSSSSFQLRSKALKLSEDDSSQIIPHSRDQRNKLSDHHIVKMKNLASRNMSCKNLTGQSFSFSPATSPKMTPVEKNYSTSNVEELKRLIRQAKENHMRLKTTF